MARTETYWVGSFDQSWLCLIYLLFDSDINLEFVAEVPLAPAEFAIDPERMKEYDNELQAAAGQPLPEEDEDL